MLCVCVCVLLLFDGRRLLLMCRLCCLALLCVLHFFLSLVLLRDPRHGGGVVEPGPCYCVCQSLDELRELLRLLRRQVSFKRRRGAACLLAMVRLGSCGFLLDLYVPRMQHEKCTVVQQ